MMPSFREVMTEELEKMGRADFIDGSEVDLEILAKRLQESSDMPQKATLFVEKFFQVSEKLNELDESMNAIDESDKETIRKSIRSAQNKISEAEQSLDELLEASKVNSSLEKFAMAICATNRGLVMMLKEMLKSPLENEGLVSGLEELFEEGEDTEGNS